MKRNLIRRREIEQQISVAWRQVLPVQDFGTNDNFFDLGGNSILLIEVHQLLRQIMKHNLPVTDLFIHPTISSLAGHLTLGEQTVLHLDGAQRRAELQRRAMSRGRPPPRLGS
jgi:Phosphopantetheine attachment site